MINKASVAARLRTGSERTPLAVATTRPCDSGAASIASRGVGCDPAARRPYLMEICRRADATTLDLRHNRLQLARNGSDAAKRQPIITRTHRARYHRRNRGDASPIRPYSTRASSLAKFVRASTEHQQLHVANRQTAPGVTTAPHDSASTIGAACENFSSEKAGSRALRQDRFGPSVRFRVLRARCTIDHGFPNSAIVEPESGSDAVDEHPRDRRSPWRSTRISPPRPIETNVRIATNSIANGYAAPVLIPAPCVLSGGVLQSWQFFWRHKAALVCPAIRNSRSRSTRRRWRQMLRRPYPRN